MTDSSSSINDASDKVEKSDEREEGSVSTDKSPADDKPINFFRAVRIPVIQLNYFTVAKLLFYKPLFFPNREY